MPDMNQSLRALAILADADHQAFLASGTVARYAREGGGDRRHFAKPCTA